MNFAESQTCIIFNPYAKGEKAGAWESILATLFAQAQLRATVAYGDGERLAREAVAQGYTCIIAAGGDGTVNEVVNGLADSTVSLGVLPLGTQNVFAEELGIPTELSAAAEVLRQGRIRQIDLAEAHAAERRRFFVQLAGVGLDAEAVRTNNFNIKKHFGPLSYVLAAAKVATREAPVLTVRSDDGREEEGCFVLVGNGRYYGGPFEFFPGARLDDGLLDVCVFKRGSYMDLVHYFQGILCGTHTKFEDVEYWRSPRLRVNGDRAVPFEVDGELAGKVPVEFSIQDRRLRVWVPA